MINIVLPISRPDYLKRIFAQLELMDCDIKNTNLLAYIDGDHKLYEVARNLVVNSKFAERLCVMRAKGTPSVGSVRRRRQRISSIHNEIKEYLNESEYIFLIEDDTLFPTNALRKLQSHFLDKPHAGIISAVELGRWGFTHIGAWDFDDVYEPSRITSPKLDKGLKKIDATGLYCCLVRTQTYLDHKFEPFEEVMGPDVQFGITLRREGLNNYIDHDLKCTHLTKKGMIKFSNSDVIQVKLEKTPDVRFGWKTEQI